MRKILTLCVPVMLLLSGLYSCTKESDPIPVKQEIVTADSTLVTGELEVFVKYVNGPNVSDAPSGSNVRLYATYEDLSNGYDIYNLLTDKNSAYFGFINYGTYYVYAEATVSGIRYTGSTAVQVRPNRYEVLTITLSR